MKPELVRSCSVWNCVFFIVWTSVKNKQRISRKVAQVDIAFFTRHPNIYPYGKTGLWWFVSYTRLESGGPCVLTIRLGGYYIFASIGHVLAEQYFTSYEIGSTTRSPQNSNNFSWPGGILNLSDRWQKCTAIYI